MSIPATSLFLTDEELTQLTGRKMKSLQKAWLKAQGIPFRVSATGHPVVTRAAILGQPQPEPAQAWTPRFMGAR